MYSCHSFLYNKLCAIKEVHMTFEWHNKDLNPITSRYFKHTFCAAVLATLEAWDKWSSSPALHWMSLIILGWEGIRTAKSSLDQAFYSQVLWRSDQDLEPVWWSRHTQSWPGVGLFAQGLFIFSVIAGRLSYGITKVWCPISIDHFGFFYSVSGFLTFTKQILKVHLCIKQKMTSLFPEIPENWSFLQV